MSAARRDPTERFSDRAQAYASGRPGYPAAIGPHLARELGLAPGARIADLGSGTGLSSRIFLDAGFRVVGVEPNAPMRAVAEAEFASQPAFSSVGGMAQGTTLDDSSVDCIAAAQAFHWFDIPATRSEALRILKRPPRAVLIWNVRRTDDSGFAQGYEQLLLRFGREYPQIRDRHTDEGSISEFFGGPHWRRADFDNPTELDFGLLSARASSTSYLPGPGDAGHAAMMAELRSLFEAHQRGGRVAMGYVTRVYYGNLDGNLGATLDGAGGGATVDTKGA
jgi:SAM-dependent methyltransferase